MPPSGVIGKVMCVRFCVTQELPPEDSPPFHTSHLNAEGDSLFAKISSCLPNLRTLRASQVVFDENAFVGGEHCALVTLDLSRSSFRAALDSLCKAFACMPDLRDVDFAFSDLAPVKLPQLLDQRLVRLVESL